MTVHEPEERRKIGRPRSAQSHQAILDATLELVAEEGIQGASIEAIAGRAGVGKATIYRRWPSKEALVLDALSEINLPLKLVDTGNLREDLITALKEILQHVQKEAFPPLIARLMFRVFGEADAHPEFLRAVYERVYAPRLQLVDGFIKRAQARGELRQNVGPVFAAGLLLGPLLYHVIASHILPSASAIDQAPEQIVDAFLNGIGAKP